MGIWGRLAKHQIKHWIPEDRLLAHLSASTVDELGRVGDVAFAAGFRKAVPVPGATQGEHQVLHGAIDPSNAPSLATAKRVGRIEVMHTHLIAL